MHIHYRTFLFPSFYSNIIYLTKNKQMKSIIKSTSIQYKHARCLIGKKYIITTADYKVTLSPFSSNSALEKKPDSAIVRRRHNDNAMPRQRRCDRASLNRNLYHRSIVIASMLHRPNSMV